MSPEALCCIRITCNNLELVVVEICQSEWHLCNPSKVQSVKHPLNIFDCIWRSLGFIFPSWLPQNQWPCLTAEQLLFIHSHTIRPLIRTTLLRVCGAEMERGSRWRLSRDGQQPHCHSFMLNCPCAGEAEMRLRCSCCHWWTNSWIEVSENRRRVKSLRRKSL